MISLLTTEYWKKTGPYAPWGEFDKDAELAFSFDGAAWAAASGTNLTVQSFTVLADGRLTITAQALLAGEMTIKIKKADPSVAADIGQFLAFTLRMFLSDGQHDDRTFFLQIRDR
jgi:hypothetical protein